MNDPRCRASMDLRSGGAAIFAQVLRERWRLSPLFSVGSAELESIFKQTTFLTRP